MEDKDRQIGQVGVGSIVEVDLGLRQRHLFCDSNHCVFSLKLSRVVDQQASIVLRAGIGDNGEGDRWSCRAGRFRDQ